ncbi:peptidoglycan DD-metalloendopeptidase family protein [Buchnera aphidicola]|uniref:peptidoglycan DD-metalloendopeptidase family protein n=1 Tax=Buchnera aphidicola TaxID=9 RepID=UPI003CE54B59
MLLKLFVFFFLLFFYHIFSFSKSCNHSNYSNCNLKKQNIKKFIFYKKNEIFRILKSDKKIFSTQHNILIKNKNFIGFLNNNNTFKIFYIVKSKDTLYSIAKKFNYNYHKLSNFNLIKKPNKIIIGQKIWIGDVKINHNHCYILNKSQNSQKKYISCKTVFIDSLNIFNFFKKNIKFNQIYLCINKILNNHNSLSNKKFFKLWYWPVFKKEIKYFNNFISSHKKIEISGVQGQSIFAASSGEVVCVIDSLKKYGRLIIIKNDKNYLSIYAFNDLILVKEKDKVHAKQKIATMGLSPYDKIARLYFEIRYQGNSINPLTLLPAINLKS